MMKKPSWRKGVPTILLTIPVTQHLMKKKFLMARGLGKRHPINKPNTWSPQLGSVTCVPAPQPDQPKSTKPETKKQNLAWFSYWWKRMEREAVVDRGLRRQEERRRDFREFFVRNNIDCETNLSNTVVVKTDDENVEEESDENHSCMTHRPSLESKTSEVISEHHHHHQQLLVNTARVHSGRTWVGGTESPAKRNRKFSTLLQFWGGKEVTTKENHVKAKTDCSKMSPNIHISAGISDWTKGRTLPGESDGLNDNEVEDDAQLTLLSLESLEIKIPN